MELNVDSVLKAYREMVAEQSEQIIILKATIAALSETLSDSSEKLDSEKSE